MRFLRTGLLVLVAFLVVGAGVAFGQATHDVQINIGPVALIGVDSTADPVVLTTQAPFLAGDPVTGTSDDIAVFYTVLTAVNYRITAQLDALPVLGDGVDDVQISLNAAPGAHGANAGPVTLTAVGAQDIITEIGSTVTGRDPLTSPLLTYTLVVNDVSLLAVGDTDTVQVTLTLESP